MQRTMTLVNHASDQTLLRVSIDSLPAKKYA
jgi:hypothetical protein